jgi:hypothetical protein
MAGNDSFTFQLESMSVDVSYNEKPEYETFEKDEALTGDATINLQISAATMRKIFKFAVDSSDITDVSSDDIKYVTNKAAWAGLDIFGDAHAGLFNISSHAAGIDVSASGEACADGENGPFTTHKNGAGEFVRHLASEITGGHGSSDIFSNEVDLLQAVKDLSGTVNSLIQQKISVAGAGETTTDEVVGSVYRFVDDNYNTTSGSIGGGEDGTPDGETAGTISNNQSILGRTLLLQLLTGGKDGDNTSHVDNSGNTTDDVADGRARVYKVLQERQDISSVYGDASNATIIMPIPLDAGDIVKFNVVVRPNGENSAENDWHGLGVNAVAERRYLVNLHLTGPKIGSASDQSYMPAGWAD